MTLSIRNWSVLFVFAALWPHAAAAQNADVAVNTPQSPISAPLPEKPAAPAPPFLSRWLDLQNATLNLRYRFVDTSAGVVTTNQLQHRESLRGRLKFDKPGRYALNFGLFTGVRFTSGWDNTGWGINPAQKNLAFKALYASVQPVKGIEGQVGGLYIAKGESTELTTYDDDGYVMGERVSIRRPRNVFFDEISVTNAYFVGGFGPANIPVSKRFRHIDESNYQQYLVDKKIGSRVAASADFTVETGRRTVRQAVTLKVPELKVADGIIYEQYQRTNTDRAQGFALSLSKQLTKRLSLNQFGYARIDSKYGSLNADRFNIGNRAFVMATYVLSPEFTASFFITTAVGHNGTLPQRTLINAVITYNVIPALKRTGIF